MITAQEEYKTRFDRYSKESAHLNELIKTVSNVRLILFVLFFAAAFFLYRAHQYVFLAADVIIGTTAFIGVVVWHSDLYRKRDALLHLMRINECGLLRLEGNWGEFKDSGDEFIDHEHAYSWDLDIFGKNSIYQWINSCHTYYGRINLANVLREPVENVDSIYARQTAIRELAEKVDWRQKLELSGFSSNTGRNPECFLKWSEDKGQTLRNPALIFVIRLLPYLSLVAGSAGYVYTGSLLVFSVMYSIQLAMFALFYSRTTPALRAFEKNSALLLTYSHLVETIEKQHFVSPYLAANKDKLNCTSKCGASAVLKQLSRILNATEIRNSIVYGIANIVWLWDLQCVIKADAIKKNYGSVFRKWIETIGAFEALSSLSIINFEHPQWSFPSFNDASLGIKAESMGHPLLKDCVRVDNNFNLEPNGTVAIITGSNMSGKSTILRSVGTNLVLAYAGVSVCARKFDCSIMKIYSSMRINDDLSTHVSTFYAELLRIKKIVEAVKRNETVLFLLDELFRGTNSQDRHDGAVSVLHALLNRKSIGIISTHDMELCKLAETDPQMFVNYHFEEQYIDKTITFDYKIRNGPSVTKNAMFLIRMIGIEN